MSSTGNITLDTSPALFTQHESNEFNASIINAHRDQRSGMFNMFIIVTIIVCIIILIVQTSKSNNCYYEYDDEMSEYSNQPEYSTETNIDSNGTSLSIVTDNRTGRRVATITKSRNGVVETKTKMISDGSKMLYRIESSITYKDSTFKEIAAESHVTIDLDNNDIIEKKELTNTDGVVNMTIKNIQNSELYKIMIPKSGAIENEIFILNKDETIGALKSVELLSKSGSSTVHVKMVPDSNGKIIYAERNMMDAHGNIVNSENITTEMDKMFISNFTNSRSKSGFTGDLPAVSADVDITGDDYAAAAMKMSLEPSIYDQQKKYVKDRNRFSNVSGYASERDDPNNLIPWMGLRPPVYGKNVVGSSARSVPSELNEDQMTSHKQIRWN